MTSGMRRLLSATPLLLLVACSPSGDEPAAEQGTTIIEEAPATESMSEVTLSTQPRVYFITPSDGDVVSSPVVVTFGIEGMAVVPAGQDTPQSGHHHVIIDVELPNLNLPIPADAHHVHFGDGSSATELELEPGEHTLQLLFANFLHIPHDPAVKSERMTITVE